MAILAKGSKLAPGDGASPESFSQVLQSQEITLPNPERATIENTNHNTSEETRTYTKGLKEPGDASFLYEFNPGDSIHVLIQTLFDSGDVNNWESSIPTSPVDTEIFPAIVTSNEIVTEIDGIIMKRCSIKVTGPNA